MTVSPSATRAASTSAQLGLSSSIAVLKNGSRRLAHRSTSEDLRPGTPVPLPRHRSHCALRKLKPLCRLQETCLVTGKSTLRRPSAAWRSAHRLFLTQRFFDNLVALLGVPSTRFGHLFLPAGSPSLHMAFILSLIPCSESAGTRHYFDCKAADRFQLVMRQCRQMRVRRTVRCVLDQPNSKSRVVSQECLYEFITVSR